MSDAEQEEQMQKSTSSGPRPKETHTDIGPHLTKYMPPYKKRRTVELAKSSTTEAPKPLYFVQLPLELLAEILLHTHSPAAVLAVARCSKYLCATLVNNPASAYIWKRARATCLPCPIPTPLPLFTEASYAAFIFDGGECEICKKWTSEMYTSFALRVRLCRQTYCRSSALKSIFKLQPLFAETLPWLPVVESNACVFPNTSTELWPSAKPYCRMSDWLEYEELGGSSQYQAKYRNASSRLPRVMKFSVALFEWKRTRKSAQDTIRTRNKDFGIIMAKKEGWNWVDLSNTPSFRRLYINRNDNIEQLTILDFDSIRASAEAEILQMTERLQRRTEEAAYRVSREEIAKHHNRLNSNQEFLGPLPPIYTFRQMPMVRVLQSRTAPPRAVLRERLQTEPVAELLQQDLDKWQRSARAALAVILDIPVRKSANQKKLHPVDRLTARFRCKECNTVAERYADNGCLDFRGACSHVCRNMNKKQKAKAVWQSDRFIKDEKAIAAVRRLLAAADLNEEEATVSDVDSLKTRILCTSCDAAILMDFESVVGHSHRHEDMQLLLLSPEEAASITSCPVEFGLFRKMMESESKAGASRGLRMFCCRHCTQKKYNSASGPPHKQSNQAQSLFTFDGLRSHVKAKHHISDLRDEDFYRLPGVAATPPVRSLDGTVV